MNYKELTDAYKKRTEEFLLYIETTCSNRSGAAIAHRSPSYLEEVIIPVFQSLAIEMQRRKIKIPNPTTYRPIKGYYRIRIGQTTVGGFSVPENGDFAVYFTPMKNAKPIGEKRLVSNAVELLQLINNQLKAKQ